MSHEARDLILFTDNTGELYRQKDAFLANMHAKMKRGTYDPVKGVALWMYYVERAAKQYAKENLSSVAEWSRVFPPAVRREVAKHYEREERGMIERGEYSKYALPTRRADHVGAHAPAKRRTRRKSG